MNEKENACPLCGAGELTLGVEKNLVSYKGESVKLDSHFSSCDTCGSVQANSAQIRANKRIMTAFKKKVDGFLLGREIRELRESRGLTQKQATQLFGGGPVAFSKYENDDILQSESMDNQLRLAFCFPGALEFLAALKGVSLALARLPATPMLLQGGVEMSVDRACPTAVFTDDTPPLIDTHWMQLGVSTSHHYGSKLGKAWDSVDLERQGTAH